jgi:hypothetical protein
MNKLFIETPNFTAQVGLYSPDWDREYARMQIRLMVDPELGKVMKGCGGLRKVRLSDPNRGKGKRGGLRLLYLHVPEVDWIYFIHMYGKDERDDVSAGERAVFAQIAEAIKTAAASSLGQDTDRGKK